MTRIDTTRKWSHPLPVWVSRPDADGNIATLTHPLWFVLLMFVIITLNALGWGIYGLVALVSHII